MGAARDELERIGAAWPGWKVWTVPKAIDGSLTWCAHPEGDERAVIDAGSAGELEAKIAAANGRLPGS